MTRYMTFLAWALAVYIGGLIGNVPGDTLNYGIGTLVWGIIITNWCYGTRNPTGLPYFNPPEEK